MTQRSRKMPNTMLCRSTYGVVAAIAVMVPYSRCVSLCINNKFSLMAFMHSLNVMYQCRVQCTLCMLASTGSNRSTLRENIEMNVMVWVCGPTCGRGGEGKRGRDMRQLAVENFAHSMFIVLINKLCEGCVFTWKCICLVYVLAATENSKGSAATAVDTIKFTLCS